MRIFPELRIQPLLLGAISTISPFLLITSIVAHPQDSLSSPAADVQDNVAKVGIPSWVIEVLEGKSLQGEVTVQTDRHPARSAAELELRDLVQQRVSLWLDQSKCSERLRGMAGSHRLVDWVMSGGSFWIGPADKDYVGVARFTLDAGQLIRLEEAATNGLLLKRVEEVMLGLLGAAGTLFVFWACLTLDHRTRHHFSRRFQAMAIVLWLMLAIGIVIAWWYVVYR